MADSYHTSRTRFAGSKTSVKHHKLHTTDQFMINYTPNIPPFLDEHIAELMETLRLHINSVLRLPLPVQKRSRLVRNYWEIEYLVKELRLLFEPG